MQGQGPIHGSSYPLEVLLASTDMIALDRVAAEIIKIPINKVYALEAARLKGYGNYDLDKIEVSGVTDLAKTNKELEQEMQLMVKNIDQAKKVHEQCTTRLIQIQAILQDRVSQVETKKTEVVESAD